MIVYYGDSSTHSHRWEDWLLREHIKRTNELDHSAERYLQKAETILQDEYQEAHRRFKGGSGLLSSVACRLVIATHRAAPGRSCSDGPDMA